MADGLARRLGTGDAVVIGLSAMIGAGVFAAFGPAALAARSWLIAALALAAVVAYCNATSSARLAALYPESGGTYVYGRRRLGPFWGYLAGWGFIAGKTASCAAMALTFGAYVAPGLARPLAVGAVVALTALNLLGVQRSAMAARIMVTVVVFVLATVAAAAFLGDAPSDGAPWQVGSASTLGSNESMKIIEKDQTLDLAKLPADDPMVRAFAAAASALSPGVWGVLQGAGLLFFAFAGYARIATLGEEVRDPSRTIPRAIGISLGITLVVYTVIGFAALHVLGPVSLGSSQAPLVEVVTTAGADWLAPVVKVGAAVAALGALLALILGVSRTVFAMSRERDLPSVLAAVHPARQVPHRAELVVGVAVIGLVLVADLRGAIGFSSFGVLVYYAIANASAFTLTREEGAPHKAIPLLGLALCLLLAATLPMQSVLAGLAVFAVGAGVWAIKHRARRPTP